MKKYPVTSRVVLKRWAREVIKWPYFGVLRWYKKDPFNYHYFASQILAQQRAKANRIIINRYTCREWESRLNEWRGLVAYLPFQLFPEMNAEYWSVNDDFMPYELGTLRLIDIFRKKVLVLVKEHPAMLGYRDPAFYRELMARENVVFIPAAVPQRDLISLSDVILTMNSSVGIEAVLDGKPVVITSTPYYATSRLHLKIGGVKDLDPIDTMLEQIRNSAPLTDQDKKALFRSILSSCIECDPNESHFNMGDVDRVRRVDHAAQKIAEVLPQWLEWGRESIMGDESNGGTSCVPIQMDQCLNR